MIATMVITLPMLATTGLVRHVQVSLPRVDALIAAEPGKYALSGSLPAPQGLELRALYNPRMTRTNPPPRLDRRGGSRRD